MKNFFLLTVLFGILIGCSNQSEFDKQIRSLENSQAKWNVTKVPTYSYQFKRSCFCPFTAEVTVVVDGDSVIHVLDPETEEPITVEIDGETINILDVYPEIYYTIDQLFEELKKAAKEADEMDLAFNAAYGYPSEVFIDYYKTAIDDEISYRLDNLKKITTITF